MFDLRKKEITGISFEDDVIRMANILVHKDRIVVKRVQSAKLVQPLYKPEAEGADDELGLAQETDDEIFGLDDDELSGKKPLEDELSDNWDMAEVGGGDSELEESNGSLLSGIFTAFNPKSSSLSLGIPFGNTYLQNISDVNLKKTSKRKLNIDLHDRLEALYGHPITDDQMVYQQVGESNLLLASIEAEIPTLRLVDEAIPFYNGKIFVRDIVADEAVLIGLVRANYELLDHQYTCIVHVEEKSTHIIFIHGTEFHSILPIIAEGSKTNRVVRTIFSKILFEVDRGQIPTLDRIILTGSTVDGKLTTFLADQFLDVEVSPFEYDGNYFEIDEEIEGDYRDYLKPIGIAWSAAKTPEGKFLDLSLVPKYVQTRQQVFKLAWHGIILLFLIAMTPIILNQMYQERSATLAEKEQQILRIDQQLRETRAIANMVDRLSAEYTQYETKVKLLDTLSHNTLKWSRTLRIINNSTENVNSLWFTSFQADNNNVILQGISLYRDRIPKISNSFGNATIQQVVERELRGLTVYEFTLIIASVTNDPNIFRPEKVKAPENLLLLQETGETSGVLQN